MFFSTLENILDKAIVSKHETHLDSLVASFYRNFLFWIFAIIGGFIGIFGELHFFLTPLLVLTGIFWVFSSIIYDYFLKNIEVSRFAGLTYIFPLLLIFLDTLYFKESFSLWEIIGIFFLVLGATSLSLNFSENKIKQIFSKKVWLYFFISFFIGAIKYGLFKYYFNAGLINEISFYASVWLITCSTFILAIFALKKQHLLIPIAKYDNYLAKTSVSKFFDFLGSIFFLKAISTASLTSVHALSSVSPFMLLILVFILQKFGLNLDEDVSHHSLFIKIFAVILLCSGGMFLTLF